jgi:hypothetical protein
MSIDTVKDVWAIAGPLAFFVLSLVYYKFVKKPVEDLKLELTALKKSLGDLVENLDKVNKTRVAEAVRDEETRNKVEELRGDYKSIYEKTNNLSGDIVELRTTLRIKNND